MVTTLMVIQRRFHGDFHGDFMGIYDLMVILWEFSGVSMVILMRCHGDFFLDSKAFDRDISLWG